MAQSYNDMLSLNKEIDIKEQSENAKSEIRIKFSTLLTKRKGTLKNPDFLQSLEIPKAGMVHGIPSDLDHSSWLSRESVIYIGTPLDFLTQTSVKPGRYIQLGPSQDAVIVLPEICKGATEFSVNMVHKGNQRPQFIMYQWSGSLSCSPTPALADRTY